MPRRTSVPPWALPPRDARISAQQWLYATFRAAILDGRLRPGARLPATRDLARQYCLARGTVVSAFDQLRSEGYLEGRIGSGTYVSSILPDHLLEVRPRAIDRAPGPTPPLRRLARSVRRLDGFAMDEAPTRTRAFRANQPAVDLFPMDSWAEIAARRHRRASAALLLGCGPLGYRPLREAIADYLNTSRGVVCRPDQIAVVSGVQEALDLIGRLVLEPGDAVGVEDPGYPGAVAVFEAAGARIVALPIDDEGAARPPNSRRRVRLIYVTPAHQFPLGLTMSLPRRLALLDWARASGALIVEDDYDSEYRYQGRPVPALQGLDRHGVVVFIGTFSKVLFPSLRLGYLVVPPDLIERLATLKSVTTRHAPVLPQAVLCDFMTGGLFGRHVRRMRQIYAERLGALSESARHELGGLLELSAIEAGLQITGRLAAGLDADAAVRAAAERDVEVTSLRSYTRGRAPFQGLLLGFAAVDAREITRGIRDLASALRQVTRHPAR